MPVGLTLLSIFNLPGLIWEINATNPWPSGATSVVVLAANGVTLTEWTRTNTRTIQWESNLNQAAVDSIVDKIWQKKSTFTWALPQLDVAGNGNAAPSGVYQTASPPTTGKEKIYDLVNGSYTPAGPEWTVSYTA